MKGVVLIFLVIIISQCEGSRYLKKCILSSSTIKTDPSTKVTSTTIKTTVTTPEILKTTKETSDTQTTTLDSSDECEKTSCNLESIDGKCPECVSSKCGNASNIYFNVPYPGNCSKFCRCDVTGTVLFICPADLVFDEKLGVCVWPNESDCSNDDPYPGCCC